MRIKKNGEADERFRRPCFDRKPADGHLLSASGGWPMQPSLLSTAVVSCDRVRRALSYDEFNHSPWDVFSLGRGPGRGGL